MAEWSMGHLSAFEEVWKDSKDFVSDCILYSIRNWTQKLERFHDLKNANRRRSLCCFYL